MRLYLAILFISFISLKPRETRSYAISKKYQDYKDAVEAIYAVTLRLEALISNNGTDQQNFLVSPISAALIIGQLMLGAEGPTQDNLRNLLSISTLQKDVNITRESPGNVFTSTVLPYGLLHLQLGSLIRNFKSISSNSSFTLEVANALFYNTPIKLKDDFAKQIRLYYDTETVPVNFTTQPVNCQKTINDWGSLHTKGLIKTILKEPAPTTTSGIFANAIYFKGNWKTPFSSVLNIKAPFHTTKNEKVENVTYMQNFLEDIPYFESEKLKLKMVSLPYEDNDLSLYILLPDLENENAFNINAFSQNLKANDILEIVEKAKQHDVSIKLPKMSLTKTVNLLEPLKKYLAYSKSKKTTEKTRQEKLKNAIKSRAFKDSIDDLEKKVDAFKSFDEISQYEDVILRNAGQNENLVVSNLFQEITFSIHENGTEAAAISAGIIDYMGGVKTFNVDRPFVFFVRHEETSATVFWGTICNPIAN